MIGELAAVSAAFLWALASLIYARIGQGVPALALNLGKGIIALVLLAVTLVGQGLVMPQVTLQSGGFLWLSGALGIGLGDTLYLEALRCMGARKTLLLETLAPAMTAGLARLFLQETLSAWAGWGMAITLGGVAWVISERVPVSAQGRDQPLPAAGRGVILAILAAMAQAVGAVLSRAALANTPVRPEWGAGLRLLAGVMVLLVWGVVHQRLRGWWRALMVKGVLMQLCLAAFAGTYLGIWLQQVSLKYTLAAISQTLGATSPLFALAIATLMGQTVSTRAWWGGMMAVAGVALLLSGVRT